MLNIPRLQRSVILAPYTTYQIGGPADWFVEASTVGELVYAVKEARRKQVPYFILGCGANILVSDKGFRGLVIHNKAKQVEFLPNQQLRAASGAIIAELIESCRDRRLSGLEHFVGIPSTVGGAIWQNLHFLAPDRQSTLYIGDILVSARVLDEQSEIHTVDREFFRFGYDDTILHHRELILLDATLQLATAPGEQIQKQMDENMAWRVAKQPQLWEYPSCGSVFKKIEGVGAGRLIDQVGLKGKRIGNAEISPKHANYIVNLGGATAADVVDLIDLAKRTVKEQTGYMLETEIRFVGQR